MAHRPTGKRAGPQGLTNEHIAEALRKNAANVLAAAQSLGITDQAIYQRMRNHPELAAIREETRVRLNDIAESHLFKGIQSGKWEQIKYWLDRQAKDRGYATRTELSGPNGEPLPDTKPTVINVTYIGASPGPETEEETT